MATFSIVAIPFVVLSGIMFALASRMRKSVYIILGGVFLASALVNSILGLTTGI